MRNHTLLFILLIILPVALAGCVHSSSSEPRLLKEWLEDDPQGCLDFYIHGHDSLFRSGQYDSLASVYETIIRQMPRQPSGNRDTLRVRMLRMFSLHHQVLRKTEKYESAVCLLDSVRRSEPSFLSIYCLYPLLAAEVQNSMMAKDDARTERLAIVFDSIPEPDDASVVMQCCHVVSWAYHFCSSLPQADTREQERALAAYRRGGQMADAGDVLARMGYFHRRDGNYERAVDVLHEAIRWYEEHPGGSPTGRVRVHSSLASLYVTLELYDKALECNARAIGLSLENDSALLSEMYHVRSALYSDINRQDSALFYLRLMEQVTDSTDRELVNACKKDRLKYMLRFHPDSAAFVLPQITALFCDSNGVRPILHASDRYWLGLTLVRSGNLSRGLPLMEQARKEYSTMGFNGMEEFTARGLLDIYAAQGMGERMVALYPRYEMLKDSLTKESKLRYTAAANVRYETGRKEQENRVLAAEIALKERTISYTYILSSLFIALLILVLAHLLSRRRQHLREIQLHGERISTLLSTQQELNRHNEQLTAELERTAHRDVIDNVRSQLNPTLLCDDDERRFRRSFAALYPHYLPVLRTRCPELTRNDELLCMLIYLNQNTDEIALALGISRASVNSGRSRIRKKLGMDREEQLDDYLRKVKR